MKAHGPVSSGLRKPLSARPLISCAKRDSSPSNPDGARACPPAGGDRFKPFSGHGGRYVDDVAAWPSVVAASTSPEAGSSFHSVPGSSVVAHRARYPRTRPLAPGVSRMVLVTRRWTGSILPQFNDNYTFYTQSSDGIRLWVNDKLLIKAKLRQ